LVRREIGGERQRHPKKGNDERSGNRSKAAQRESANLGHSFLTPAARSSRRAGHNLGAICAEALHSTPRPAPQRVGQALAITPLCFVTCVAMKSIRPGDKQS
jgi:hypothetical protein